MPKWRYCGKSFGNICIATDSSGAEEIIDHGENGFICKQKNSLELVKAIERVISAPDLLVRKVSDNAIKVGHKYSWVNVINTQYDHFFVES